MFVLFRVPGGVRGQSEVESQVAGIARQHASKLPRDEFKSFSETGWQEETISSKPCLRHVFLMQMGFLV
jgi:hypothetical protein